VFVTLAIASAGAIGSLFGWYPAHRAGKTSPIDALHFE
jgi:ABC-type antimicrobial peptide transport system permease subunit